MISSGEAEEDFVYLFVLSYIVWQMLLDDYNFNKSQSQSQKFKKMLLQNY